VRLEGRTVVVGLTGGIACYKACEVVRLLVRAGATVPVMMTAAAREFVTPLTLQTLSGRPVATDTFSLTEESEIGHIRLADRAEAILIAPAMNVNMWKHPAVRENLARLVERGVRVVEPATGQLACGWEGPGRLAEPEDVVEEVLRTLAPQDLAGERILVTAGPTQEPVDPVRYLSNHSSGKMGYALARVARRRGAQVTLVSGPTALPAPRGVEVVGVRTAAQMARAVDQAFGGATVVVMTAAVADYRPRRPLSRKLKKTASTLELALERNPDILAGLGSRKGGRLLVGFAAETHDVVAEARRKLAAKHLDLIVANDVTAPGAGFGGDTNAVRLIDAPGLDEAVPVLPKEEVAGRVLDWVAARRPGQRTTTLRPARAPGAPRRSRRSSGRDA